MDVSKMKRFNATAKVITFLIKMIAIFLPIIG